MKRVIVIFIGLLLIMSCSQKPRIVEEFSDGKLYQRYHVIDDSIKQGELKKFDPDGKVMEIAIYNQNVLDGQRKLFFPDGQIEILENYTSGTIHGDYQVFYDNGNIKLQSNYQNGILEGISTKYFVSGAKMEEVSFKKNEENGPFTEYYDNGNKKWEGNYLNGDNEFGLLLKYSENGELVRKMMCDSLAICRTFWTIEEETDQ